MTQPRVLLITSNGWGMGHLVRQLSIAAALPADVPHVILTLSGAAAVAARPNLEYAPSYTQPWVSRGTWHGGYLRDRILLLADEFKPTIVVFDGVVPYPGLLDALRQMAVVKVWMRRGLWRRNTNPKPLQDSVWFDAILEPTDIGDALDQGPTAHRTDARKIGVVTQANPTTALDRAAAAAVLGVDPNRPTLLLNLGSAAIGDLNPIAEVIAAHPDWQVLTTKDELGRTKSLANSSQIQQLQNIFPLHPYLHAVDLALTSAGYNAAHEFVGMGLPAIYVPAPNVTDDQAARARAIVGSGAGWMVEHESVQQLTELLGRLLSSPAEISAVQKTCQALAATWSNGSSEAAELILDADQTAQPPLRARLRLWMRVRFEYWFGNLIRRTPQQKFTDINFSSDLQPEQIASRTPFEHLLPIASGEYLERRRALSTRWMLSPAAKSSKTA